MDIYAVKILEIDDEILNCLYEITYFDKRYKNKRYLNKNDEIRTLIGKILIRSIVAQEYKVKNRSIYFSINQWGKPFLEGYPEFNFNISHSEDYVLCAVDDKPIGIDIEKIRSIEYEDIAKSFFTKDELDYIVKKDIDNKLNKFYEIWTLKESYIKCCGQGLCIPLKSFSVINKLGFVNPTIDNKYNIYTFKKFCIGTDYKIAVCSLNNKVPSSILNVEQNDLINDYLNLL